MTPTMIFVFEELPLVVDEKGFDAGPVNGEAELSYHRDGTWTIRDIWLDSHRKNDSGYGFQRGKHRLDAGTPLYLMIFGRLEGEWAQRVQSSVEEQIEADRIDVINSAGDHRRDSLVAF